MSLLDNVYRYNQNLVWDVATLSWVAMLQPSTTGGGGGGGGAVTIADGADVTQGTTSDAAWVSGNGTVISLLKKLASAGAGSAVSIADGSDVVEGAIADAAVVTDANGSVSAKLRGLVKIFASVWDSGNGRLKVDGSTVTQPVSAASLPLPTGAATSALQTTGNTSVASIDTKMPTVGQKAMAASSPIVVASDQTAIPISAASLPLPTGAATEVTLALVKAKTDNLDVALSTRTKPADQQHTIIDSGTTVVTQPTGTNLHVVVDSAPTTAVTGPLTDTQLRASAVPVSAASLPLPTGAATSSLQTTGNTSVASIDTKLTDRTQKTQLTDGAGISGFEAAVGNRTELSVEPADGNRGLRTYTEVIKSLPAGTAVLGHVIVDSAPTTVVNQGTAAASTAPWYTSHGTATEVTATWNSGTTVDSAITLNTTGLNTYLIALQSSPTGGTGTITVEGTDNGTNWISLPHTMQFDPIVSKWSCSQLIDLTGAPPTSRFSYGNCAGMTGVRLRLSSVPSSGTHIPRLIASAAATPPIFVTGSGVGGTNIAVPRILLSTDSTVTATIAPSQVVTLTPPTTVTAILSGVTVDPTGNISTESYNIYRLQEKQLIADLMIQYQTALDREQYTSQAMGFELR